jgi:uncharacterized protein (TIGR00304 family)
MQNERTREESSTVNVAATWILIIGFTLMLIGITILIAATALQGNMDVSGGGIVFIGPIPIIFGAGPNAFLAILLAAVLTIIGFLMFFWLRKKSYVVRLGFFFGCFLFAPYHVEES